MPNIQERFDRLGKDEKKIMLALLDRMELGKSQYGEWRLDDARDMKREAWEEVIDGLHYAAAGLLKQDRGSLVGRTVKSIEEPEECVLFENIPEEYRNLAQIKIAAFDGDAYLLTYAGRCVWVFPEEFEVEND